MVGKVEKLNRSSVAEKVHKTLQQYEFNTISDRLYIKNLLDICIEEDPKVEKLYTTTSKVMARDPSTIRRRIQSIKTNLGIDTGNKEFIKELVERVIEGGDE